MHGSFLSINMQQKLLKLVGMNLEKDESQNLNDIDAAVRQGLLKSIIQLQDKVNETIEKATAAKSLNQAAKNDEGKKLKESNILNQLGKRTTIADREISSDIMEKHPQTFKIAPFDKTEDPFVKKRWLYCEPFMKIW